jgi:hypothetical protein
MMTTYKLYKNPDNGKDCGVLRNGSDSIPFAPDNTDYANFKKEILADEAQLQDADGKTMTANKAKEFVATLP